MRIVLHPFVAHFPIALLLLNLALTLAYLRRGDPFLERAAYGALVIGWWSAFAAVLTGTLELALAWPVQDDLLVWVNVHAVLGFALLWVYGQALLMRKRDARLLHGPRRRRYLSLLILGALLVLAGGWVGGYLVHHLAFGVRTS
ncbi:DUF2231 domain-containing protein [Kallotenue papyrolyticum]|uniref:DUF2231 domain-containing protein n=1 Tax=Kallotenue papyrolyticum TaxID=1325125 RepID=UPI00047858D8|nr:DUF2231 domain-containing protein [Kallotenue papyrolyticum]